MIWEILLGLLLAVIGMAALALLYWKWLFPLPLRGWYVLRPRGTQADRLEQQLRGLRWLRQMGLLHCQVLVVTDELPVSQGLLLAALQRQGLLDRAIPADQLRNMGEQSEE